MQLVTPKVGPGQWDASHGLGCSSEPPPKSPIPPRVSTQEEFRIERVYPRGGPVAGGTNVTVTGFAFADLDDGHGLSCQFGDGAVGAAALSTTEQMRADGRQQLMCVSPPAPPGGGETVVVRVTNNGQDFTSSEFTTNVGFTYYQYEDEDE